MLVKEYGSVVAERVMDPIDELILTILSQNTADVNTERAFRALKSAYSSWEEVLGAPEDELAPIIRSSGPFRVKAKRIKAALGEIMNRVGALQLDLLANMNPNDAMDWLVSLHGVGPKTASIVLLFCFDMPVLPVDTHVWRITKRLGLIPSNITREKAQKLLMDIIPSSCVKSMNHNLVKHGRNICKSQNPLCVSCFLRIHCIYHSAKKETQSS
ncbi:MAG: endonuclease III [Candidatus Thorarchaeota archaeon]|nr:endonuclease III [Candidatus Thorarchaeota archaeon]